MIAALSAVGAELESQGVVAKLYVVGGAAMVLSYDARDATFDVDGDFSPRDIVTEVADEVARRQGLPSDWLNSAANGFIPAFKSPDWQPLLRFGTLEVLVADDRTMLAMKIRASRGKRDEPDIALLLERCGIASVEDALHLYEEYFPEDRAPKRAYTILEYLLNSKE
jgi:hypothetical protein